jgi:hypothetical protein
MSILTPFGACAVAIMLHTSALEQRPAWCVLIFTLACAASALCGWRGFQLAVRGSWECGHWSLCDVGGCDSYNDLQQPNALELVPSPATRAWSGAW